MLISRAASFFFQHHRLVLVFNDEGRTDPEVNPAGSVREWLAVNSLNKYQKKYSIIDWAAAPQSKFLVLMRWIVVV